MRENAIKAAWRRDQPVVNGWLTLPAAAVAEIMAHQGWDSLTIDLQHGLIDYGATVPMLQAISTTATVPVVRVPFLDPGIIMKVLDAGAYAVICPLVNTPEEAARFVAACRYPPEGSRSFGPIRASLYAGSTDPAAANREIATLAMIETREGLARVVEIVRVPGLDAVYVGPSDLALSLGYPPRVDPDEPTVVAAIDRVLHAAQARGMTAGVHTDSAVYAGRMIDKGFRFVTAGTDVRLLDARATKVLGALGRGRR